MRSSSNFMYQNEDNNAVEISKTARGEVVYTVKVYHESPAKAKEKAVKLFDSLRAYYEPPPVAAASAEAEVEQRP